MGMEKLHPFDARKWKHIFKGLKKGGLITEKTITKPKEAKKSNLLLIHTQKYLNSLKCSLNVARIAEVPPLMIVPNFLVQYGYLRAMRYQTGGSILAGKLALDRGWAINIGGGFHHCSAQKGSGFCPYADISLLIEHLFQYKSDCVKSVMIIDLDAHQGNGYEHDFEDNPKVYIMDVYNKHIYPRDKKAEAAINCPVRLSGFTEDSEYLTKVEIHLEKSLNNFQADIVIYNAGSDVLQGDRLGLLSVTPEGILQRDELVFRIVRGRNIPIVMLMSGEYLRSSGKLMAQSILNLHAVGLISGPTKSDSTQKSNLKSNVKNAN